MRIRNPNTAKIVFSIKTQLTLLKGSDLSRQQGKVLHVTGADSDYVETLQLYDADDSRTGRGQYFILVRCLFIPALFYSVVDRHRYDADLDSTFHFDADPDPDPILYQNNADPHADPTRSFTDVGK